MFNPECVCFADIPETELQIHISKYSKFGIAFHKSFLIGKGANPILYIEENSITYKNDMHYSGGYTEINRVDYYQEFFGKTIYYFLHRYLNNCKNESDRIETWEHFFFLINLFSHLKVWDDNLEEHDENNYYFEREWRANNNINFELSDVFMIILPKDYGNKFKLDFPQYMGKLEFAEDIEDGTYGRRLAMTTPP